MGIPEEIREKKDQIMKVSKDKDLQLAKYSDGPYDLQRLTNEIKFLLVETARNIVEIGKRLIVVREQEDRGNWLKWIEDNFPFNYRTAYRWINAAQKIATHNLTSMSNLNITKVYTLMEVSEEELKQLEQTGSIAGMNLDEIDRMSTRELKDKLRRYKQQVEDGTQQLQEKDEEIERLKKRDAEANPIVIAYSNMTTMVRELLNNEEITEADWKDSEVMRKAFDMQHTNLFARFNPDYEPVDPDEIEEKLKREVNGKGISA